MARRGGPAGISPHWHSQQLLWEGAQPGDAFPCLGKDSLSTFCLSELVCFLLSNLLPALTCSSLERQPTESPGLEFSQCRGSFVLRQLPYPAGLRGASSQLTTDPAPTSAPQSPLSSVGSSSRTSNRSRKLLLILHASAKLPPSWFIKIPVGKPTTPSFT